MLEKGIRLHSEASWLEAFGNEFLLGHAREKSFHTAFAVVSIGMCTFFWECPHLPFGSNS